MLSTNDTPWCCPPTPHAPNTNASASTSEDDPLLKRDTFPRTAVAHGTPALTHRLPTHTINSHYHHTHTHNHTQTHASRHFSTAKEAQ